MEWAFEVVDGVERYWLEDFEEEDFWLGASIFR